MDEVRVKHIGMENVRKLPNVTLNFGGRKAGEGQLVTLTGGNDVGKTTFLDGTRALFAGGHDPDLIRHGEDKCVIRCGTTDGVEYTRTITRKGYYLSAVGADGLKFDPPESHMKKLAAGFGLDPIAFDKADKKQQMTWFLKVMPLVFAAPEIKVAMGDAGKTISPPTVELDINGIGKLIKELTDKRAAIGSRRDEKANSVESFRKSLLASDSGDDPKDWTAEVARLTKERDSLDASERADIEGIQKQIDEFLSGSGVSKTTLNEEITGAYNTLLAGARSGIETNLSAKKLETFLNTLRQAVANELEVQKQAGDAKEKIYQENVATRQTLAVDLEKANGGRDTQTRMQGIRDEMQKLQKEALALSDQWQIVDDAVKRIEKVKQSKLMNLPVEDLEVRDGELYLDGSPWGDVNQARRWLKAIEIGAQGVGSLGLLTVDEAEHLEPINWLAFQEAVIESGLTVIAVRVQNDPREIEKFGRGIRSEPASALVLA